MRPRIVFILLLSILIIDNYVYNLIIPTALKLLDINVAKNAAANYEFISMLSPAYLLAVPIFTICSDKWGRKSVLVASLFLSVVGYGVLLIASMTKSMLLVLLAIVLLDLTSSTLPLILAFTADITHGRQKTYYFTILVLFALNDLPIVALGSRLSAMQDYPWINASSVTLAALLFGLANVIFCIKFLPKSSLLHVKRYYKSQRINFEEIIFAFSSLFTLRKIRPYILTFILAQFACSLYLQNGFNYFSKVAQLSGTDIPLFGMYSYALVFFIVIFISPLVIPYVASKKIVLFCMCSIVLGVLLNMVFSHSAKLPWFSALLIYPQLTVIIALLWTILSDETDKWHQGILLGALYVIWSFLWTINGILVNFFNSFSSYCVPILTIFFMGIAVIPLAMTNRNASIVTQAGF